MKSDDWKICAELGLNHLGNYDNLIDLYSASGIGKLNCSLTIQIREESFYEKNPELKLGISDYENFKKECHKDNKSFGLALGALENFDWIIDSDIKPDFLKVLSIASEKKDFLKKLKRHFKCPLYISTGLSSKMSIKNKILPHIDDNDYLIHTSISHKSEDQNLKFISEIKSINQKVCFGLHASNHFLTLASIGAGAEKVFVYIGDKTKNLPDNEHSIKMENFEEFYQKIIDGFKAVESPRNKSRKQDIKFLD